MSRTTPRRPYALEDSPSAPHRPAAARPARSRRRTGARGAATGALVGLGALAALWLRSRGHPEIDPVLVETAAAASRDALASPPPDRTAPILSDPNTLDAALTPTSR